ncbi:hypothetical protein Tco_1246636 [Tanacetum coccineum]
MGNDSLRCVLQELSPISNTRGRKKSWESNIGDSDNIGDRGKTGGGAIGACGSGIGEIASEAKRSLDRFSKESEEVFPDEAEK